MPEPTTLLGLLGSTGPRNSRIPGWPLEILTQRMIRGGHGAEKLRLETDNATEIRRLTYQKFVKDYLRCVAAIDENIGRVLEYLDKHGLAENTMIIYTSDQGYFLGEHNYFDKRFMLEESLRMPFVVRYPREIKPGTRLQDIILNVDFARTFLDYAEADPPSNMQGHSFRGNLAGNTPSDWRDSMYYRYFSNSPQRPAHYGLRTHKHKLIHYDGLKDRPENQQWELYDLVSDPRETKNVYDDSRNAALIEGLKTKLTRLRIQLRDS